MQPASFRTLEGRRVTDTTGDPAHQPFQVTAYLTEPVVTAHLDVLHLDGPLSWAVWLDAYEQGLRLAPITDWAHDLPLPLATWTAACPIPDPDPRLLAADGRSVWGWACSAARYQTLAHTAAEVRRRPDLDAMALWTGEARHHTALGPRRAANLTHQATWVGPVTWQALGDPERTEALLARVTHLGRLARHGWGRVARWQVTTLNPEGRSGGRDGWRDRLWPDPAGTPGAIRAPYWHPSRKMPCRRGAPHPAGTAAAPRMEAG